MEVTAISSRNVSDDWWLILLQGGVGIYIGILIYRETYTMALVLVFYLAVSALLTGAIQLVAAMRLRKEMQFALWYITRAVLSLLFGLSLLLAPLAGPLAILWLIGTYSIVSGGILLLCIRSSRVTAKREQQKSQRIYLVVLSGPGSRFAVERSDGIKQFLLSNSPHCTTKQVRRQHTVRSECFGRAVHFFCSDRTKRRHVAFNYRGW